MRRPTARVVTWDSPLSAAFQAAAQTVQLYALRKRASLFGVNAPDPHPAARGRHDQRRGQGDWKFIRRRPTRRSRRGLPGDHPGERRCVRVCHGAASDSPGSCCHSAPRSGCTGSPQADRPLAAQLHADQQGDRADRSTTTTSLPWFVAGSALRDRVRAERAAWRSRAQPLIGVERHGARTDRCSRPVAGDAIRVAGVGAARPGRQRRGHRGKRARLRLDLEPAAQAWSDRTGAPRFRSTPGDVFLVDAYPPPAPPAVSPGRVLTTKGVAGTLTAPAGAVTLLPADKADAEVSEAAVIDAVVARAGETDARPSRRRWRASTIARTVTGQRQRGGGDAWRNGEGDPRQRRRRQPPTRASR